MKPRTQSNLFVGNPRESVVNVASVPQRSPFRYPGGKTWLVPTVRRWLGSLNYRPRVFYEPFAGGGIVSLTVACEDLADRIIMVEKDEDVAAVWEVALSKDAEALSRRILEFELTRESVEDVLREPGRTLPDHAFQTIIRNRVYHGGILAPGSGLMKNGENGRGIKSRWYPKTIAARITAIAELQGKVFFIRGDGMDVLHADRVETNVAFFIDPPYTVAGKRAGRRLYKYNELDHRALFDLAAQLRGDFLMTYDDCEEVRAMAEMKGFEVVLHAMKNTHNAVQRELLVARDVSWMRQR